MASSPKIDDLRKRFEENPRRYFAPLANEYRKAGDIEQAIRICREHLPQQPGHMSGHIVFGQALYEARQLEEARTVFETALSLDPENLIALKHLGDITLMAGDTEAAKGWYKRVLEADPRNEETLAQLASIEAAAQPASGTPTPVASLSSQPTVPIAVPKATAASSAPTVVMSAVKMPVRPDPAAPAATPAPQTPVAPVAAPPVETPPAPTADSPTAEIRLEGLTSMEPPGTKSGGVADIPTTLVMEAPQLPRPEDVTPTIGLESTSMAPQDAPMAGFSLEGLESTSLASEAPPPPPPMDATAPIDLDFAAPTPAAPAAAPSEGAAPAVDVASLDLDIPAPADAAPPPSTPEPPATVELDLAPSANIASTPAAATEQPLEFIDMGGDAPPAAPTVPALEEIALDAPPAAAAEPGPAAEIPIELTPAPQETAAPLAEPAPSAPAPASGPFVTETMAELYLQQGHRDEALRVYRALLADRPGDASLQAKVAGLEAGVAPTPAPAPDWTPAPVAAGEGPPMREVLLLVAQRRPGYRADAQNGAAMADPAVPPGAALTAPAPASFAPHSRLVADSLGALWGSSEPAQHEEQAALVLATAFADLDGLEAAAGDAPLVKSSAPGAAAAAAPPAGPPPGPPSSFSFDKFFSQRATAEHAATPGEPARGPESREDVAHFNRWLEGLKQQ